MYRITMPRGQQPTAVNTRDRLNKIQERLDRVSFPSMKSAKVLRAR